MKKPKKKTRVKERRFTVSLTGRDYERLKKIASAQEPPCSLTFVINRALQVLFARVESPQGWLEFAHPLHRDKA